MRLFHIRKLSDSNADFSIHSSCYDCERKAKTPARELLAQYGDLSMSTIRKHAVCKGCKSHHVVLWEMDLLD